MTKNKYYRGYKAF